MADAGAYIRLGYNDLNLLQTKLKQLDSIELLGVEPNFLRIRTNLSPEDLNRLLAEQSIYLNHLSSHQKRLEELFLELTQQQD